MDELGIIVQLSDSSRRHLPGFWKTEIWIRTLVDFSFCIGELSMIISDAIENENRSTKLRRKSGAASFLAWSSPSSLLLMCTEDTNFCQKEEETSVTNRG